MNPYAGAVDHPHVPTVSLCDRVHYRVPHTRLGPPTEPVVAGRVGPVAARKIRPRRAGTQNPEDAVQNPAIIDTRHTTRLLRQDRLDNRPLEIRHIVTGHGQSPLAMMNQIRASLGIPLMSVRPSTTVAFMDLM